MNIPWLRNLFWVYPMELLGNMGQMEARFGLFGDCVNLDVRLVHDLRQKSVWTHLIVHLRDVGQVDAHIGRWR
jgi:hypothetical protein